MSGSLSIAQRIQQLRQLQADLPQVLASTQKAAAIRAVEAATEAAPPKQNDLGGTNARSGQLKAHWATDSRTEPEAVPGGYKSILANNQQYASYVDKGFRMDRHFVPGLYINSLGKLEYDPARKGEVGLTVGTKTQYVRGQFMVDKAVDAYRQTILALLDEQIEELTK